MDKRRTLARPGLPGLLRFRVGRGHLALVAGAGIAVAVGGKGHLPGAHAVAAMIRGINHPQTAAGAAAPAPAPGLLLAAPTAAGRTVEALLDSPSVGEALPYLIYLPPGYDTVAAQRYPVLYMLHGLGGDEQQWQRLGLLDAADRLIRAGAIPPLIIVMPRGEQAYWMDHADGGPRWGRYVVHDLVNEVDARYRTVADRDHRAIGGLSMGGHGALQLALNHPELFAIAGAHSLALRRHAEAPPYFGDDAYFAAHDPVSLVRDHPDAARALTLWVDIGTEDGWRGRDEAFHAQLQGAGITHQFHEWPGGHDDAYWSAHLDDYLRFYGAALRRALGAPLPAPPQTVDAI